MPFSSFNFLLSLPFFVVTFWLMPARFQKGWLIVLSLVVYMAAGWRDLALLVGTVALNWAVPRWVRDPRRTVALLVLLDLALLGWFKYRGIFDGIAGRPLAEGLVIPLGMSFYVFQLISYQVELAQGRIGPRTDFGTVFLYIFFFPHHQAGPIMRPHAFLPALERPRTLFRSRITSGLLLLLWGLAKKVWIADVLAPGTDQLYDAFHRSGGATGNLLLLGVQASVQIYADFSGYSDMAVGLGRLFGFRLDRNFRQPFTAEDATTFWNRWHITLSTWLRDFATRPLLRVLGRLPGRGRRRRAALGSLAVLLTMVVGGVWHGPGWTFLLWGAFHGILLLVEHAAPRARNAWVRVPRYLLFQLVAMSSAVLFRERSLSAIASALLRRSAWTGPHTAKALVLFAGILAFSWAEERLERRFTAIFRALHRLPAGAFATAYSAAFYAVVLGAGRATTFVYQRF